METLILSSAHDARSTHATDFNAIYVKRRYYLISLSFFETSLTRLLFFFK
jgi:hypothetical protein